MEHSLEQKIRVLHVSHAQGGYTGSPKAVMNFLESLDRSLFTPILGSSGTTPLAAFAAGRGVEIAPIQPSDLSYRHPLASLSAIRQQIGLLRRWNIDLVHATGFFWTTDVIMAAWHLGLPVVVHLQNPAVVSLRNLDRFAARRILFCSDYERRATRHFGRIEHKTAVLHNVINTSTIEHGTAIRSQLGLGPGDIAIGTVAQLSFRKGIDILIDTARLLMDERADLVWLIVGPVGTGEDAYAARLQALAAQPEMKGRVRFLGPRSDIPDILASLDLFLHPARAEPFGIAIVEAMAAGVPVVASKVGGIPEILSSPELGLLVEPIVPGAFASAIRCLLALPDRGRSIGDLARRHIRQNFALAAAGRQLTRIYLELLGVRL